MVLFHIISLYQLINVIEYAELYCVKKYKVLIMPTFIKRKLKHIMELKALGLFDEVLLFDYTKYNGKAENYITENLQKDFDALLSERISEFEDIYVGGAQYYFSIYLIQKNREFTVFEDGAGLMSRLDLLETTIRNQKILCTALLEKYNLFKLDAPLIKRVVCLLRAQVDDYKDDRAIDFDAVHAFSKIGIERQEMIKSFFGCPKEIKTQSDSVLLLTQNFANLKQLSFHGQILIYQIFYDFFLHDRTVVIKPHPDDIMYYEKILPDAIVIKEKFPSELLPYIFKEKPLTIATISSTGMHLIAPFFHKQIEMKVSYEKTFPYTDKYYTALKALQYLQYKKFIVKGTDTNLFEKMVELEEFADMELSDKQCRICIMDIVPEGMDLSDYNIVIFLNTRKEYEFTEYIALSEVYPICINKIKKREEECFYNLHDEQIYVYMGKDKREQMKEFEFRKDLGASGVELAVDKMSEQEIYINCLEGQVKALEKRLLHYINISKEKNK